MNQGRERPPKSTKERFQEAGATYKEAIDAPELHAQVQLRGFESIHNAQDLLQAVAKECREYALSPIISDDFGNNHSQRREWHETLPPDLYAQTRHNKLRGNLIHGVASHLEAFIFVINADDIHTLEANKVRELYAGIPTDFLERYSSLSQQEKEMVVAKLDTVCRAFLRVVTQTERST